MASPHPRRRPSLTAALFTAIVLLLGGCVTTGAGGGGYVPLTYDTTDGAEVGGDTATDDGTSDTNAGDTGGGEDTHGSGCTGAIDCDDGDACTNDGCTLPAGICTHSPIAGCGALFAACSETAPCKTGVCDPSKNACVACIQSSDCGGGNLCKAGTCVAAPACKSDVECKATNQVCATSEGVCVDCVADTDYGSGNACKQSGCVAAPAGAGVFVDDVTITRSCP